jgi:hypothetical protein
MLKHALSLLLLFAFSASFAAAQAPPPSTPPPALDDFDWEVRDGDGVAIGYHMIVTSTTYYPWSGDVEYELDTIETSTGKTVATGTAYAESALGSLILDVTSSDSGLEYTLVWWGDHYKKFGGTDYERDYYPI